MSTQIQAQLYIVTVDYSAGSYPNYNSKVTIISPDGNTTEQIIPHGVADVSEHYSALNIILNDIISEGYKITHIDSSSQGNLVDSGNDKVYYLAVPWTSVGLTEIDSSNLDLKISPNPANEYINVAVDFKSQPNELVLISEQGYVFLRKDISNIKSGQEFTLDISNVPAGKYLVTVKNEKEYLTPQKLVIF